MKGSIHLIRFGGCS